MLCTLQSSLHLASYSMPLCTLYFIEVFPNIFGQVFLKSYFSAEEDETFHHFLMTQALNISLRLADYFLDRISGYPVLSYVLLSHFTLLVLL